VPDNDSEQRYLDLRFQTLDKAIEGLNLRLVALEGWRTDYSTRLAPIIQRHEDDSEDRKELRTLARQNLIGIVISVAVPLIVAWILTHFSGRS
jgi:hypothetical protein